MDFDYHKEKFFPSHPNTRKIWNEVIIQHGCTETSGNHLAHPILENSELPSFITILRLSKEGQTLILILFDVNPLD